MTTDQKYDGKENLATNLEQTAQNDPQTANSADPAQQPAEQFTVDLPDPEEPKPVSVPVTKFLANHFHSAEKTTLLRQALKKVFEAFYFSDEYLRIENLDTLMAYKALQISLDKMIVRGAERTSGPRPDEPVEVPGDIEENPQQPEAYEVYMRNPANYSDVGHLQEWIGALQQMSMRQSDIINAQNKIAQLKEEVYQQRKELVEEQKAQLALKQRLIDALEKVSTFISIPATVLYSHHNHRNKAPLTYV
jgi:hypothetical protein